MKNYINKVILLLVLVAGVAYGNKINSVEYNNKSNHYYKKYKKEYDKLPIENKKRILDSYYSTTVYDLGYTMAATRFLENRGMETNFSNKKSIGKNQHKDYVTYDCGDYGINTMTYLRKINKVTKNKNTHIEACKKLSEDKNLNLTMALDMYNYGLTMGNGNILKSWNVYNTGNTIIKNDRIYMMKGIIMVLENEIKKNKIEEYRLALN